MTTTMQIMIPIP